MNTDNINNNGAEESDVEIQRRLGEGYWPIRRPYREGLRWWQFKSRRIYVRTLENNLDTSMYVLSKIAGGAKVTAKMLPDMGTGSRIVARIHDD